LLPWKACGVDLVFECTGRLLTPHDAGKHLQAGAKKVLISAPGNNIQKTIVYGVNHAIIEASDSIISNASCTTNCLAPILKPLHEAVGIRSGLLNTVHAFTKDQMLLDGHHKDLHRARSATASIIPTKTGAAKAVAIVLPELAGKLDGFAMRVPTMNVSVIDFTFISNRKTQCDEINQIMHSAQNDILHYSNEPLVSFDFNHHKASAIFDSTQTKVIDTLVKVIAWYDNEWGFSNRMLDTGAYMMNL
jgi:glyceraldehyde 3-phosphate dehydrogenase